ncbi:hypothetical protein ABW20_dc0100097 [Dactylellina cionopaga]|nr:hypothetical protein ABW20_dc0100097 [Dactylellina cionopaga]
MKSDMESMYSSWDAEGEKVPDASGSENAPANSDSVSVDAPKEETTTATSSSNMQNYLPCRLKFQDSKEETPEYANVPAEQRKLWVSKIIEIMGTWDQKRSQPIPITFLVSGDGDISLQPPSDFISTDETISQYEPHFWIPDSCLLDLKEEEKGFRREFFAVGCLVYQIIAGHKAWSQFSGPQAQRLYEQGVYPSETKNLEHWRIILSYWSWEFVEEVTKKTKIQRNVKIAKRVAIGVGVAGCTVVTTALLAPLILPVIGFGSAGVGAGTLAATWHSAVGLVEAGSVFAILQSAGAGGAAGAAAITAVGLGGGSAAVAAGAAGVIAGTVESQTLKEEDLFALFLTVVRKKPIQPML